MPGYARLRHPLKSFWSLGRKTRSHQISIADPLEGVVAAWFVVSLAFMIVRYL